MRHLEISSVTFPAHIQTDAWVLYLGLGLRRCEAIVGHGHTATSVSRPGHAACG
jgi:hypothetical protein